MSANQNELLITAAHEPQLQTVQTPLALYFIYVSDYIDQYNMTALFSLSTEKFLLDFLQNHYLSFFFFLYFLDLETSFTINKARKVCHVDQQ